MAVASNLVMSNKEKAAKKKSKFTKKDHYKTINDKILSNLDSHNIPWKRPWSKTQGLFPKNYTSGKIYRGVNLMSLMHEEFYIPQFLTFNQAKAAGLKIKKGEKSHDIFFFKQLVIAGKEENEEDKTIPMLKHFNVFSVTQLETLPPDLVEEAKETQKAFSNLDIMSFISDIGPRLKSDSQRAYYSPSEDFINMPKLSAFKSEAHYFDTLFHELVHWTGHHTRVNRQLIGKMGSETYSKEELVAEFGSAYLCAIFGIDNHDLLENSKSYIKGWGSKIRGEKNFYYQACSRAQKAVDYLLEKAGLDIEAL